MELQWWISELFQHDKTNLWEILHKREAWPCGEIMRRNDLETFFTIENLLQTSGDSRIWAIFFPVWGSNWGIQVFPMIKITVIVHVCHLHLTRSERKDKHMWKVARCTKTMNVFCLCLFSPVWLVKARIPQIGAPWLTRPLLRPV